MVVFDGPNQIKSLGWWEILFCYVASVYKIFVKKNLNWCFLQIPFNKELNKPLNNDESTKSWQRSKFYQKNFF